MEIEKPNELIGIVIGDEKEQKELIEACFYYEVKISKRLVKSKRLHPMWGLLDNEIGLLGTEIMRRLPYILHGINELKEYMEKALGERKNQQ